ncbi:prepilin-type N-terminal cleavage/methylation domain-containing protein [Elusimicrobium posterum]|uniref:prepilin-type N-terminal cleavage/methylation domain-containing protein n=1 Tax=Elusimicrobium posterum TaxID=3116653 RepID=UPI003C766102
MFKIGKKAFTLVEVLVVVVIVTLAVVLAVPSLRSSQATSRNQRSQAVLSDLASAVRNYRLLDRNANIQGEINSSMFADTSNCSGLNCLATSGLFKNLNWDSTAVSWDASSQGTNYCTHTGSRNCHNGYRFFVCPRSGTMATPPCKVNGVDACSNGRIAVMVSNTNTGRFSRGTCAWINADGSFGNNYNMDLKPQ